jgi:hypothetical protein
MTTARSAIAPPGAPGYYHDVMRCVRRSFLCGFDQLTGRSFDHRRGWVAARMKELGEIFAVRVLAFSSMTSGVR